MPSKDPTFFVIVLNWNGWLDTKECLASLRSCAYDALRIVVVDNGSADGTPELVAENFPEVVLLQTGANLGFSGGNNVGIKYALEQGADCIMLLNNDTVVDPQFVEPLVEALSSGFEVVSPLIYYYHEKRKVWFAGSRIDWKTGWPYHTPANVEDTGQFAGVSSADYISGCAMAASAGVWQLTGLLDPDFFLYFEDAEWSVRASDAGLRLGVVMSSHIWHKVSATQIAKPLGTFLFVRNGLQFVRKRAKGRRWPIYLRFIEEWVVRATLREWKRGQFSFALFKARLDAVVAHVKGSYGAPSTLPVFRAPGAAKSVRDAKH